MPQTNNTTPVQSRVADTEPPSTVDISQEAPLKSFRKLASFFGTFMETARNATQIQGSTSSKGSNKHRRNRGACKKPTQGTSLIPDVIKHEDDLQPAPIAQPLDSMRSSIQSSVRALRHPTSSAAELATRPSSSDGRVLLRSLTARSHLLLKSINSTVPPSPMVEHKGRLAMPTYPASSNISSASPNQYPSPSSTSSRLEVLAALQHSNAQIILSSSPTLPVAGILEDCEMLL